MTAKRIPLNTIALLLLAATFAATAQTNQNPGAEKPRPPRSQDPANYIEVIEESGNNRILQYYPDGFHDYLRARQFKVDAGSTLILRIVPERLNTDAALSNLLITAQLKHGSTSTNVEVKGYSVVGQSQNSGQSQNAVNLNSIANVGAQISSLYYTSHQIIEYVDGVVKGSCLGEIEKTTKPFFDAAVPVACGTDQVASATITKALTSQMVLYTPEIDSLVALFSNPQNAFLSTYFSNDIFGMDLKSVASVATEFQQAVTNVTKQATATATSADGTAKAPPADPNLWPRVVAIYEDLWTAINDTEPICKQCASIPKPPSTSEQKDIAVKSYLAQLTKKLVERLKEYLVDGQIVLADYKPVAGDVLEITIEAQTPTSGNGSTGSILHLGITMDNFGVNAGPSTSLFFLKRMAVSAGDLNLATPITPVTFAPAPGGSFGFTWHYRSYGKCDEPDRVTPDVDSYPQQTGTNPRAVEHVCSGNSVGNTADAPANSPKTPFASYTDRHPNFMREPSTGGGKFLRALAPGLAMNVSFMNWNLPADYDITTGKFATSTSTSVQVGTGFVVSLFDNMAQFTYGWNLQVTTRREYWGLGFGFLEVGKTLAGLLKSKTTTPSQ